MVHVRGRFEPGRARDVMGPEDPRGGGRRRDGCVRWTAPRDGTHARAKPVGGRARPGFAGPMRPFGGPMRPFGGPMRPFGGPVRPFARTMEQRAARTLEGRGPQGGGGAVDRDTELQGHGHLVLGHVPRLDDGGPATDEVADLGQQVGAVEQLLRQGPRAGVVEGHGVHPALHPARDGGGHEVAQVGQHLGFGCQRADEHEVAVDPAQQQRGVEVAVLHRRDPGAVVLEQGVAEAVGGHRDDDVVAPGAGHVRPRGRPEGPPAAGRSRPSPHSSRPS